MTAHQPSIGVVTPSLNYRRYLADTVSSVAAQSHPGLEHVVQDGGSTDGSADLLADLADRHPGLSFRSAPDSGQSDALNRAAALTASDWLGWLNADEFYLPGAVSAVARVIAEEPDVDVVYGDCVFVDASGTFLRLLPAHPFSLLTLRHYGCFISSCATFVRRRSLPPSGWDTRMRRAMDWRLWLTLSSRGARFRYVPRALAAFRVHDAQVTSRPEALAQDEFDLLRSLHGLPRNTVVRQLSRRVGQVGHVAHKARAGGYLRQVIASRAAAEKDLRWWLTRPARSAADRLVEL